MATEYAMLLALALTLAIPVACVVFPSLIPAARFNQNGHRYFIDIAAFKGGFIVGAALFAVSALRQGETDPAIIPMVAALALVLALLVGFWAHLIYRRQQ